MKGKSEMWVAGIFLVLIACPKLLAQQQEKMTVAVLDFKNNSSTTRYDRLQRAIPEMLKTELSACHEISVVERNKIESILSEQALAQAGFVNGEQAQQVGRLAGAEYLITGEINTVNGQLRVDAHLIKVASGQIIGEKVTGRTDKQIDAMIRLLANNFIHELSGTGIRKETVKLTNYQSTLALITTGSLVALTTGFHIAYRYNYDKYHKTTALNKFNSYYDRANKNYQARNVFFVVTGFSALATFFLWQKDNGKGNKIYATRDQSDRLFSLTDLALAVSTCGDGCTVSLNFCF